MSETVKEIIKITDNIYRVSGITNVVVPEKEIEIDGVIYVERNRRTERFDLDKYWVEHPDKWYTRDFSELSFLLGNIKVFFPAIFYDDIITDSIHINYAQNLTAKFISHIIEDHGIGKKYNIWQVKTRKDYGYPDQLYKNLIENTLVEFPIYAYGWNNVLYLSFTIYDFLRLDLTKLSPISTYSLKKVFEGIIDEKYFETEPMDDKTRREIALIILQDKINHKK
jgi:hypothetical protein